MTTEREALKLALEALESCGCDEVGYSYNEALTVSAITAIKEALAQPEQQQPVAKVSKRYVNNIHWLNQIPEFDTLLYTTPPQRKPLTHEQRFDLLTNFEPHKHKWEAPAILIDMVEAAHGIKE